MKIKEGDIINISENKSFIVLKIKDVRNIEIKFLDSNYHYIVDESGILSKNIADYKFDEYSFINKEYIQKSGDIIFVLEKCTEKIKNRYLYKCFFKETLNIIYAPKYKILNGVLKDNLSKNKCINKKVIDIIPYNMWIGMKERCLNKNFCDYKNYGKKNITICPEWLDFTNFYNWYIKNLSYKKEKLSLDKDILCNIKHLKEKIYSPETCLLIPIELNCWLANDNINTGVLKRNNKFVAKICGKHLGTFSSFKEAKQIYAKEKYEDWKVLLDKYNLPLKLKEILLKYDFSWYWMY